VSVPRGKRIGAAAAIQMYSGDPTGNEGEKEKPAIVQPLVNSMGKGTLESDSSKKLPPSGAGECGEKKQNRPKKETGWSFATPRKKGKCTVA